MHLIDNIFEAGKKLVRKSKRRPDAFKCDDVILVNSSDGLVKTLVLLCVVYSSCNLAILTVAGRLVEKIIHCNCRVAVEA